jgi:hypothetical protein
LTKETGINKFDTIAKDFVRLSSADRCFLLCNETLYMVHNGWFWGLLNVGLIVSRISFFIERQAGAPKPCLPNQRAHVPLD